MGIISIEHLGPIAGRFEMNLDSKLTILIGEQATGKSTIARILYYCAVCAYNWAQGELGLGDCTFIAHGVTVRKYLSENYLCGNDSSGKVEFFYDGLRLSLNAKDYFGLKIIPAVVAFESPYPIYVPAGRSTIPLLFESYAAARNINVDPFLNDFLLFLDGFRKPHSRSMQGMLAEAVRFPRRYPIDEDNARVAIEVIEEVLKGEYRYEKGNERIFYNSTESVPVTAASSGQQEVLYILLTLFYVIRNPRPHFIVIEEPEAHVFPAAQKLIMELVARVINTTNSKVVITTHSPYVLTATNLLMHSAKVESKINSDKIVIDEMARINPESVSAYLLEHKGGFSYRSIIDEETGLIVAEEIDTVSNIIDQAMSDLIDLEVKYGL